MKITKQKRLTKYFFNKVSDEWFERTYDPANEYLKFPSNRVRMGVALGEIERMGLRGKMLDVGCGTGHLVFELLRKGHKAVGIDIAEKMIEQALDALHKEDWPKAERIYGQIMDKILHNPDFKDNEIQAKIDSLYSHINKLKSVKRKQAKANWG